MLDLPALGGSPAIEVGLVGWRRIPAIVGASNTTATKPATSSHGPISSTASNQWGKWIWPDGETRLLVAGKGESGRRSDSSEAVVTFDYLVGP
jgi:hypothetical protein